MPAGPLLALQGLPDQLDRFASNLSPDAPGLIHRLDRFVYADIFLPDFKIIARKSAATYPSIDAVKEHMDRLEILFNKTQRMLMNQPKLQYNSLIRQQVCKRCRPILN